MAERDDRQGDSRDRPWGGRRPGAPCPARSFVVPDEVRRLDAAQLDALSSSFLTWRNAAANAKSRQSRGRVWLVFLLLRYGGLKLGEVLALDDRRDFDFERGCVIVRGEHERDIPLPEVVIRDLRAYLENPMSAPLSGEVFRLDQGYVRKKFQERAKACGLPTELSSPSVLRHSRAIELLRGGAPLKVIQTVLGHQSVDLTAQYMSFPEDDARRILEFHARAKPPAKTSARNMFRGQVGRVRSGGVLAEVELNTPGGLTVVSVITGESLERLALAEGDPVTATVKAPWVVLLGGETGDGPATSERNVFPGRVARVNAGPVVSEVVVELRDGSEVCALVGDEAIRDLGLAVGRPVRVLFKAFSVVLGVD